MQINTFSAIFLYLCLRLTEEIFGLSDINRIYMKVGIIRCQQTEEMCPGTACLKVVRAGKLALPKEGPYELVGFISCGGCPGKKTVARAQMMVDRGAEAIVLASCMSKGTPIGFPCPFLESIRTAIERRLGSNIPLILGSH